MTQEQNMRIVGRIMALDVGDRTVGVALSDPLRITAQPHGTMRHKGEHEWKIIYSKLFRIVRDDEVRDIVVGLPLNMNGTEGPQAGKVRSFCEGLENYLSGKMPGDKIPALHFWDERLSTSGAARELIDADVSRAKRREVIDTMAAVFILQGYLSYNVKHDNAEDS